MRLNAFKVKSVLFLLLWGFFVFVSYPVFAEENDAMGHGDATGIVVAKVNGVDINMSQLMKKMQEVTEQKYGTRGISPLLANKIKKEATDKLIIEELAYQRAKGEVGVTPKMIENNITALKKKYGGDEGFAEYLQSEGLTFEELKEKSERFLAVRLLVEKEIESKIVISDQQIIDAYQGAKGKYFMQRESVQVNSIVFFLDPGDAKAKDVISKVMQRVKDETDNDPSQLIPDGTFIVQKDVKLDKGRDAKLFEIAKELEEYAFSEPFESDGTLYVVQLTGYKPEIIKTMDEVLPYLRRKITQNRRQELLKDWMVGLKDGAQIEIIEMDM